MSYSIHIGNAEIRSRDDGKLIATVPHHTEDLWTPEELASVGLTTKDWVSYNATLDLAKTDPHVVNWEFIMKVAKALSVLLNFPIHDQTQ